MKIIQIQAIVTVPVDATNEQIYDWVQFELGVRGNMLTSNPLSNYELEADSVKIIE